MLNFRQSTGTLVHLDPNGSYDYVGTGYSGYGTGLNNPALQDLQSQQHGDPAGPLPQGIYSIGPPHYSPNTGPGTMNLTPQFPTNRTLLRIHGDNKAANHTASTGCIVTDANNRNQVANSNDTCLQVLP